MEVKQLSTTLVGNWADCPRRAWRSYQRRLDFGDDNEGTDPTRFGTSVHATMEHFHEQVMQGSTFSDDDILRVFDEFWAKNNCYSFDYMSLGRSTVAAFLRRSVENRIGETIGVELLFIYCLETSEVWVNPPNIEQVVNELLKKNLTPIASKIDRLDRISETHFKVYDYKTNIMPFTREEIETSRQLGIYDLVVRAIHPEAEEVECVFDMLRHGRFPVIFPDAFRDNLRAYLIALWKQIKNTEKPEERVNKYCRWCEIRSSCTAYRTELQSDLPKVLTEADDSPEGVATLYDQAERLGNLVKIAEERQKEIKAMISAKVVKDGLGEPLVLGENEYYLQQNPRYQFNVRGIINLLKEKEAMILLPDMVSMSKASIDRTLTSRPELRKEADQFLQKQFATPSLKRRKVKAGKTSNVDETDE